MSYVQVGFYDLHHADVQTFPNRPPALVLQGEGFTIWLGPSVGGNPELDYQHARALLDAITRYADELAERRTRTRPSPDSGRHSTALTNPTDTPGGSHYPA